MAKARINVGRPIHKHLVDTRDEIIMALHDEGYRVIEIAYLMNRSKQFVSHVILKYSRIKRK